MCQSAHRETGCGTLLLHSLYKKATRLTSLTVCWHDENIMLTISFYRLLLKIKKAALNTYRH